MNTVNFLTSNYTSTSPTALRKGMYLNGSSNYYKSDNFNLTVIAEKNYDQLCSIRGNEGASELIYEVLEIIEDIKDLLKDVNNDNINKKVKNLNLILSEVKSTWLSRIEEDLINTELNSEEISNIKKYKENYSTEELYSTNFSLVILQDNYLFRYHIGNSNPIYILTEKGYEILDFSNKPQLEKIIIQDINEIIGDSKIKALFSIATGLHDELDTRENTYAYLDTLLSEIDNKQQTDCEVINNLLNAIYSKTGNFIDIENNYKDISLTFMITHLFSFVSQKADTFT